MLVLLRKAGESIIVEGEQGVITVTVVAIKHGRVKLGIAAPAHIHIQRAEIGDGQPVAVPPLRQVAEVKEPGT